MNEQMVRLYEAAKSLCGVEGQTKVARLLNVSPQMLANWEKRGVSIEGTLKAQEKIGCNALWVRDGSGDMSVGNAEPPDYSGAIKLLEVYAALSSDLQKEFILAGEALIAGDAAQRIGDIAHKGKR